MNKETLLGVLKVSVSFQNWLIVVQKFVLGKICEFCSQPFRKIALQSTICAVTTSNVIFRVTTITGGCLSDHIVNIKLEIVQFYARATSEVPYKMLSTVSFS